MMPRRLLPWIGRQLMLGSSAALGLFGIAMLWTGLLHTLSVERATVMEGAVNATSNLSRAFEEQILRSIKAVDQSLMFVRENFARDPTKFDIAAWARSAQAVTDVAIQLTMVDTHGIVRATSIDPHPKPIDLSDREHIRVHMGTAEDRLFISKPVIGRVSQRWSIQFTRKLFNSDGGFAGVVVLSLDPTYLTRFFGTIDLGKQGAITLIGLDGVVRAAARGEQPSDSDPAIGQSVATQILNKSDHKSSKAQVGPIDFDGVRRITSYSRVSTYPLIVAVGVGERDTLANYWNARRNYFLVGGTLSAVLLIATVLILLHQRRLTRARESLRYSEGQYAEKSQLLETALQHMGQGILMVDGQRRIQVCNRHAVEMLGLPPQLLTRNTRFDELLRWQWANNEFGLQGDALDESLRKFILAGGISSESQSYERARPTGMVLDIRSTPLPDGGVVRTFTDVTERKRVEEELRFARDQANIATRSKSEFLATMSHEIRSPLSGLVGALDLLRQTSLNVDQAQMAGLAHGSALTLLSILNDILEFSKIEAGALTLTLEPVELRQMISDVTQPHALVAAEKNVSVQVRFKPGLPETICVDQRRTGQILNNLLSNAIKFTSHGFITVTIGRDEARLLIEVQDTGCGIDAAMLAQLFQPFTQADGSSSRNVGGTGLGLSISRHLAELMDGTIDVTSEVGNGSCFTLILPYLAGSRTALPARRQPVLEPARMASGLCVLLVDDDPTNQWLTKRQLELLGANVDAAGSGEAALSILRTKKYHLIVTDCHMPGMDGVALTRAVRDCNETWRSIPILGLTADVTPEQARRCREAGMNDVVYKPLKRDQLAQLIAKHADFQLDAEESVSQDDVAVLDLSTLRDWFDDSDPEDLALLEAYRATALSRMATLRDLLAVAEFDRPAIDSLAHQLVGSSLSVGANRFAAAARALEHATPTEAPETVHALFRALEAQSAPAFVALGAVIERASEPAKT